MGWHRIWVFALTAVLVLLIEEAYAADITDKTPCAVSTAAFDGRDFPAIRAIATYVLNTMDDLDSKHIKAGEPGIMSQLSDSGRSNMVPLTTVNCIDHPKMTIYNSAALAYRGIRDMQIQFGTAK